MLIALKMEDFKKEVLRHIERYEKKKSIRRRLSYLPPNRCRTKKEIEEYRY